MSQSKPEAYIDPRAIIDSHSIGPGSSINALAWIRENAVVGQNCNIVSYAIVGVGVILEDDVTVMNHASIGAGTIVRQGAFIGPNVVVTDDRHPRSPQSAQFADKYKNYGETPVMTEIGRCASVGANAVVIPGCHIGEYAVVGAGAVVTSAVPPFALVRGNPAKFAYWVDENGHRTSRNPLSASNGE